MQEQQQLYQFWRVWPCGYIEHVKAGLPERPGYHVVEAVSDEEAFELAMRKGFDGGNYD